MDKYKELKQQVEDELSWCIEAINEKYCCGSSGLPEIPKDISLADFIRNMKYEFLNQYERGMLFAFLSIKSKIDSLEEEEA